MKRRLDQALVERGLVTTRSQAESYIKLGKVKVGGRVVTKPGHFVASEKLEITQGEQYVGRAALKLAGAVRKFGVDFAGKTVLDVGSSTGGFTDYALKHGAKKVIAVDIGTNQLHASLRSDLRVEVHEKTDIRELKLGQKPEIVLIDVSFISLRKVLPAVAGLSSKNTQIIALLKPQFEAGKTEINRGIVKNDSLRRKVLKDFESWSKTNFVIKAKADSEVAGSRGNIERFYYLGLVN